MARTIRTKVFKFNELSEKAQQTAIDSYRNNNVDTDNIYDEAHETVKKFHEVFGTEEGSRSWLDVSFDGVPDNVLELKGLRLRTYIINNFWNDLFKGKYFSLWSKTEKSYKHYPQGYPVLKSRHSKVLFDNSCTLTGMAYDMSLLQPVYEFLQWNLRPDYNSYMDFETLINDCFASLKKSIESEVDYRNSDESIREDIESRDDMEFTKDGLVFNH